MVGSLLVARGSGGPLSSRVNARVTLIEVGRVYVAEEPPERPRARGVPATLARGFLFDRAEFEGGGV